MAFKHLKFYRKLKRTVSNKPYSFFDQTHYIDRNKIDLRWVFLLLFRCTIITYCPPNIEKCKGNAGLYGLLSYRSVSHFDSEDWQINDLTSL